MFRLVCGFGWALIVAATACAQGPGLDDGDPDAALRLAQELRVRSQPAIDQVLAEKSGPARAAAVQTFLERHPVRAPDPVLLDLDAAVCSAEPGLMLLDQLGTRRDALPAGEVVAISRERLAHGGSAERIVALRNLARWAPRERAEVRARLREMLGPDSEVAPSGFAFAQALDGVVSLRDVEAIPRLGELLRDRTLAPVAGMTLDRLAEEAPVEVARFLIAHPALLADRPLLRADYFAKGNVADSGNRAVIEEYLQRPDVRGPEVEKFLAGYVQPGTFVVRGIFSGATEPAESTRDRPAELAAALAAWATNPRMAKVLAAWERASAEPAAPGEARPR